MIAQVFGAYFCAQTAARKFIELGIKGSIVMTSSMTSYRPNRVSPLTISSARINRLTIQTGRPFRPLRRNQGCR